MHLVGWETIKKPMSEGGLQIRYPELANLALGRKIIWQMIAEKHIQSVRFFERNI